MFGTGLIVPQVHNKDHLLALSKVSKRCRSYVFPRLFEVLTVKSYDEDSLWDLGSYPFFAETMIAKVPNVLAAVKELCFSAPFEKKDSGFERTRRCQHSRSFTQDSITSSIDSPKPEDDLHISQVADSAVQRKQEDAEYMAMLFDSERGDYGLMKLATKIARLVSALPDKQLVSFR